MFKRSKVGIEIKGVISFSDKFFVSRSTDNYLRKYKLNLNDREN